MTQDVQDVSDEYRASLRRLVDELNKFLWEERGYLRWDQYLFLNKLLKELCIDAMFFDERSENMKDILNKLQKKSERDE